MPATETRQQGEILVVDDNRVNRIKLAHMLEEQGHQVTLAQDGREALQNLRERSFDVVLLDLLMPEMDGFQALQVIKGDPALRDVVVIVISALDEMESVIRCIELGAEDYLTKPFDPILLRARLQNSLEKKKVRDLEQAYLQQEMMLRQSEKLATLGRLCAGVAHELNNPAAAAQRSAGYLMTALDRLQEAQRKLYNHKLSAPQVTALHELSQRIIAGVQEPPVLDSLTRSDREEEVEVWLDEQGVENSWEIAADLVALGFEQSTLLDLAATFEAAHLPALVGWISATYTLYALAREIGETTSRISAVVGALKSYTYMDQAPAQQVDIHRGLEDTLVMLRHKLNDAITIQRNYAPDLPRIDAFGSELNQVWTNLIDNAIAALGGTGALSLHTRREGDQVVVTVEDSGPGIAPEVQPKIFDPFFTTRPPGQGVGLGLSIAHNIVVQRHGGQIVLRSRSGMTCFDVFLPIRQLR
ncbi:MAG: cyclic nucleotide-binding protein [Chloroflexi bacterium]|nr:MAG: cyclic nucleotide-binding protein [Chloroflexota bacterium]